MLGLSIPLYNEEALVVSVVDTIQAVLGPLPHRLALVNNGSRDGTAAAVDHLAKRPEVLAVHLSENAGYGGGILAGLHTLQGLPAPPDVIGWCWGDGQIDPVVLPELYRRCIAGTDIARIRRVRREVGRQRWLISTTYAGIMSVLGVATRDVNGCPKLFRAEALAQLHLSHTDWFLDAEAILKAEAAGMRIEAMEAVMHPRTAGVSKVGWQTIAEFVVNIARYRLSRWK